MSAPPFPPFEGIPPGAEDWSAAHGEDDEGPLAVSINASAGSYRAHPALPIKLGVLLAHHDGVEARLVEAIQAPNLGRLVLAISRGDERELVFYVRSAELGTAAVEAVRAVSGATIRGQGTEVDPGWDFFAGFI